MLSNKRQTPTRDLALLLEVVSELESIEDFIKCEFAKGAISKQPAAELLRFTGKVIEKCIEP